MNVSKVYRGFSPGSPGPAAARAASVSSARRVLRATSRRQRRFRLRLRDEADVEPRLLHLAQRLGDDARVVLRQPVLEKWVGYPNADRARIRADERRRLEPGIETMAVYLGFYPREDLLPEVHVIPGPWVYQPTFATATSPVSARFLPHSPQNRQFQWNFHSFFHRCGKLWEETEPAWASGAMFGIRVPRKDADCSTKPFRLTLSERLSYDVRLHSGGPE